MAWLGHTLGYVVAVLVAVPVTLFFMILPTLLPDDGARDSFYRATSQLIEFYQLGLLVTFPTAFPGFVVVIVLAAVHHWLKWWQYALAGSANAVAALIIFCAWTGFPPSGGFLHLSLISVPGGFAGGAAYWFSAGRSVAKQRA